MSAPSAPISFCHPHTRAWCRHSLTQSLPHSHSQTHSLSLSHSYTHTYSVSLALTHTASQTGRSSTQWRRASLRAYFPRSTHPSLLSSLGSSDTKVYWPSARGIASHFCEAIVLQSRTVPNWPRPRAQDRGLRVRIPGLVQFGNSKFNGDGRPSARAPPGLPTPTLPLNSQPSTRSPKP